MGEENEGVCRCLYGKKVRVCVCVCVSVCVRRSRKNCDKYLTTLPICLIILAGFEPTKCLIFSVYFIFTSPMFQV